MTTSGLLMNLSDRTKWIAIIGSRNASKEEQNTAHKLGQICAKKGMVVVSGLAMGIDAAGHEGAIDGGGITIAIVHTKQRDVIYPKENKGLAERIEKSGCILYPYDSPEFKPNSSKNAQRLMERSILNAYLCPTIIVVKDADTIITGGTKWATYYGIEKLNHKVYRLDNQFKFHENPKVEICKMWWMPELNLKGIVDKLVKP